MELFVIGACMILFTGVFGLAGFIGVLLYIPINISTKIIFADEFEEV